VGLLLGAMIRAGVALLGGLWRRTVALSAFAQDAKAPRQTAQLSHACGEGLVSEAADGPMSRARASPLATYLAGWSSIAGFRSISRSPSSKPSRPTMIASPSGPAMKLTAATARLERIRAPRKGRISGA